MDTDVIGGDVEYETRGLDRLLDAIEQYEATAYMRYVAALDADDADPAQHSSSREA